MSLGNGADCTALPAQMAGVPNASQRLSNRTRRPRSGASSFALWAGPVSRPSRGDRRRPSVEGARRGGFVHGGMHFAAPVRVDDAVLAELDTLVPLAPLHQPHNWRRSAPSPRTRRICRRWRVSIPHSTGRRRTWCRRSGCRGDTMTRVCGATAFMACPMNTHVGELLAAGRQIYDSLLNLCVWVKDNGGMGSFYRSRHELIFVFRNGKGQHRNNVQLGQYGRNRTNVWEYPGVNTLSKQTDEGNLLALHPTVKPTALVADALLDCSARGDLVLDAFLGSGSTLIAAERIGRICRGIEFDPLYVDVAVRRWQRHTGDHAIHAVTGKRFDDLAGNNLEAHHG